MRILVCGGAGYIGSHTCVVLAERGHDIVVADNFVNSSPAVLSQVEKIAGARIAWHRVDLRDRQSIGQLLQEGDFQAVVHFAALKSVGDSCRRPLDYFDNNISGTINLLQAMKEAAIPFLVFSSSATVYGDPEEVPVKEGAALRVTNPYGRTKLVMERLIEDVAAADPSFRAAVLRYFNPVGAHPSGLIGEDPSGIPDNLMPFICQVAVGRREALKVFGGDWPTPDGTGIRDYIHVMDLARAHVDALEFLERGGGNFTVNLGSGEGASVLELVAAFERACGRRIPYEIVERRPGDIAAIYADPAAANALLGWATEYDLDMMCRDAWRWQSANPRGYE